MRRLIVRIWKTNRPESDFYKGGQPVIIRVELVMKRGIAWQIATTEQGEEFVRGCFCTKPQICISKDQQLN